MNYLQYLMQTYSVRNLRLVHCPDNCRFYLMQANSEKQRLEVKQRAARKAAEEGEPIEPRWFHKIPNSVAGETPAFKYKGGYWEARKTGNWEGCRDIFGPAL